MSDELDGPSHEEMGLTPSIEQSETERLGNLFEEQLKQQLGESELKIVGLDKSKYFANIQTTGSRTDERNREQTRIYGILHPHEETRLENGPGYFHMLGEAYITMGQRSDPVYADFSKHGRNSVSHLSPDWGDMVDLRVHREIEELNYKQSDRYPDPDKSVGYNYRNIKGSEVGFFASFDKDGHLFQLGTSQPEGETEDVYESPALEKIKSSPQAEGKLVFSQSDNKYHLHLVNKEGENQFTVKIPATIDVQRVEYETGVAPLIENPNLPPEADDTWRDANFTQLLEIEIDPVQDIDTE